MPKRYIADLHIHSKYSRATSPKCDLPHLAKSAAAKGIHVLGTGDFTHPGWRKEITSQLTESSEGAFSLRPEFVLPGTPSAADIRFVLTCEISSIYRQSDRVRKVHSLVFMPDAPAMDRFVAALSKMGNLNSDGRPILGLSAKDLLETVLSADDRAYLVPAHVWTPWFSVLGSKSGFDSLEECFGDLTSHIFAAETGLSSDPAMCRRCEILDRCTLISNSDAHSPEKLGREANIFFGEPAFAAIRQAMIHPSPDSFGGTIEFFPEEGKYHLDGHRACGVRLTPKETQAHKGICPACGKPVTIGVLNRVEALATRAVESKAATAPPYYSLIPIEELCAELVGTGVGTTKADQLVERLRVRIGPDLYVLMDAPLADIERACGSLFAEAVRRVRAGEVHLEGGFDGEYGVVRAFAEREIEKLMGQMTLIRTESGPAPQKQPKAKKKEPKPDLFDAVPQKDAPVTYPLKKLDQEQSDAAYAQPGTLLIIAGPGAGKTRTLIERIAHRIESGVPPENVLAITFTRRASEEMAQRLAKRLGDRSRFATVRTFHGFAKSLLDAHRAEMGRPPLFVLDEYDRSSIMRCLPGVPEKMRSQRNAVAMERMWRKCIPLEEWPPDLKEAYKAYRLRADEMNCIDLGELVLEAVRILESESDEVQRWSHMFQFAAVDEGQDMDPAQARLLDLLCPPGSDLTIIGDPDQSIYSFRGANPSLFMRFAERPDARVIRLSTSYRLHGMLIGAVSGILDKDEPLALRPAPGHESGPRVLSFAAATERSEADLICQISERLIGGLSHQSLDIGRALGSDIEEVAGFADIAVLVRTHAQISAIADAMDKAQLPYQICGQVPLSKRKGAAQVLSLMAAAVRPEQDSALLGLLEDEPDAASIFLAETAAEISLPMTKAIAQAAATAPDAASRRSLTAMHLNLEAMAADAPFISASSALRKAASILFGDPPPEGEERVNIARLISIAEENRMNTDEFLDLMKFESPGDDVDARAERISLLTMHAAKGLEWPVVFLAGCDEGLYSHVAVNGPNIEEEARLMYVSMTRAKRLLIVSWPKTRIIGGTRAVRTPSVFLKRIHSRFIKIFEPSVTSSKPKDRQLVLI